MVTKPLLLALALAFSQEARPQESYAPLDHSRALPAESRSAPPLPFQHVGSLVENGKRELLVLRGGVLHSVAEGDEIDGEYRVERITASAARFTYLPNKVKQDLDLTR